MICYPIGDGSVLNIFAGHVTDQWVEESWSAPSSQEELLAAYEGWNEALLDMFRNVQHVYKWGIYDRDPIPQWTKGRVTLLGDAAHPTMPTLAQGGNMAIEDGYVLGRNLDRHRDDIHAALRAMSANASRARRASRCNRASSSPTIARCRRRRSSIAPGFSPTMSPRSRRRSRPKLTG